MACQLIWLFCKKSLSEKVNAGSNRHRMLLTCTIGDLKIPPLTLNKNWEMYCEFDTDLRY